MHEHVDSLDISEPAVTNSWILKVYSVYSAHDLWMIKASSKTQKKWPMLEDSQQNGGMIIEKDQTHI